MYEGTDNSASEEQVSQVADTTVDDTEVDTDTEAPEVDTEATQSDENQAPSPFAGGKEKFKIDGEEVELSWEETKKYAQLGKVGYKRMQEAAAVKKQVAENYKKLVSLAQTNPQGLIEILTGQKQSAVNGQADRTERQSEERGYDQRDAEIQELKQRIEARELMEERKAIDSELSTAVSKYPELNSEIYREYVKSQYTKALRRGEDIEIEDVAFMVSQSIKDQQAKALKTKQQKIKERRDRSPITTPPGFKSQGSDELDLDMVKKLAGRM